MKKDQEPRREGSNTLRNAFLIGAVFGLLAEIPLLAVGGVAGVGAVEIFSRVRHNSKPKQEMVK